MVNIFNKVLKNKRVVFSVLLFFILFGIVIPNNTLAFTNEIPDKCGKTSPIECIKYGTVWVTATVGSMIVSFGEYISYFSAGIFNYVLSQLIQDPQNRWAITRECINASPCTVADQTLAGPAFVAAWNIVKQWANMLIILGFIGVALAFILNLDQYKKSLFPILVVALLVNFSTVFIGLMIDLSNIAMKSFTTVGEEQFGIIYLINDVWNNTLFFYPVNDFQSAGLYLGLGIMFAMIYFFISAMLVAMALLFVERYVILALLFIFSPLAFVFYAFPLAKTKELFKKWWDMFLKWCFVGLNAAFFLKISTEILNRFETTFKIGEQTDPYLIASALSQVFFYLLIILIFLAIGMMISFKAGGAMSAMVIGGATAAGTAILSGGAKLAGQAGMGTLKGLGRATGVTSLAKSANSGIRNLGTRMGERYFPTFTGFGPGTARAAQAARDEKELNDKDRVSRVENMTAEEEVQEMRAGKMGRKARFDRAAIYRKMHREGRLDMLGTPDEQLRHAQEAMSSGVSSSDAVTKLSGATQAHAIRRNLLDPQARAKILKSLADKKQLDSLDQVGDTIAQNRQRKIDAIAEAQAHGVMPQDIVSKMNSDDQAHIVNRNLFDAETRGKATESLMKKKDIDLIEEPNRQRAFEEAVQSGVGPEEMEAADYHYAVYNKARIRRLATTAERTAMDAGGPVPAYLEARAKEQVLNANIGKMDGDQLRNIDSEDLYDTTIGAFDPTNVATHNSAAYRRIEKLKPESIKEFQHDADPLHRAALKQHITELQHNITQNETRASAARTAGDQALATHHTNEALRLGAILRSIDGLPP